MNKAALIQRLYLNDNYLGHFDSIFDQISELELQNNLLSETSLHFKGHKQSFSFPINLQNNKINAIQIHAQY